MKIFLKIIPMLFVMFFSSQCAIIDTLLGGNNEGYVDPVVDTSGNPTGGGTTVTATSPSVTGLSISNVTSTTADVTVTTSDADGLGYIVVGVTDDTGVLYSSTITIGGSNSTTTMTINHSFAANTLLYPYAEVYDVNSDWTRVSYNTYYYSGSTLTEYNSVDDNYHAFSIYYSPVSVPGAGSGAPVVTTLTISNVTSTTADVTVTTSDADGLSYLVVGAYDSTMGNGNATTIYPSGTSSTTTTTITHYAGAGTTLYPYVDVYDVNNDWTRVSYDPYYYGSSFTEYNNVNGTYNASSILLNSGVVPAVVLTNPVILNPVNTPIFTPATFALLSGGWYVDDLFDYSFGVQWYSFNCTAGSTYQVNWDDSAFGSGTYTADIAVSIYDADGYYSMTPVYSLLDSGYTVDTFFTNNDTYSTGTCALYVQDFWGSIPTGSQTYAVRVLGP